MAQDNDVTRRDFVKAAGAVTAVASALPAAQGAPFIQKVRAANDQVQYGFIGTGSRGTYLLKHLHETDAGRCVAVCDNWDVNLKKGVDTAGNNPTPFKDYRELLARKDIDAVMIAVPLYMHFPITKDSLQAGKNVFCEKSLVHKPEEVHALRALVAELGERGVVTSYGSVWRAVHAAGISFKKNSVRHRAGSSRRGAKASAMAGVSRPA